MSGKNLERRLERGRKNDMVTFSAWGGSGMEREKIEREKDFCTSWGGYQIVREDSVRLSNKRELTMY